MRGRFPCQSWARCPLFREIVIFHKLKEKICLFKGKPSRAYLTIPIFIPIPIPITTSISMYFHPLPYPFLSLSTATEIPEFGTFGNRVYIYGKKVNNIFFDGYIYNTFLISCESPIKEIMKKALFSIDIVHRTRLHDLMRVHSVKGGYKILF